MISADDRQFVADVVATVRATNVIAEASGIAHPHLVICSEKLARLVAVAQAGMLETPVAQP